MPLRPASRSIRPARLPAAPVVRGLAWAIAVSLGAAASTSSLATALGEDAPAATPTRSVIEQSRRWTADHLRAGAEPVRGTTHVVANCADSGPGSLRAIIDDLAVSGDEVDLSQLECSEISLETPLLIDQDSLTLRGAGRAPILNGLAAAPAGLIRHSGTGSLTLDSLTLAFGSKYQSNDSKYAGGGCVASAGDVLLDDTVAKYCTARHTGDGPATGGAISAEGDLSVKYSVVVGNEALVDGSGIARGGALYTRGGLTMKYSSVVGNEAHHATIDGASGQGGAVQANGGTFISRSTISGNHAANIGGLALFGDTSIRSSTISGNTSHSTTGTASSGANLFLYPGVGGSAYLSNVTITDNLNLTEECGGLYIGGDASASATLVSNIVSGNSGSGLSYDFHAPNVTISGDHNLVGWITDGLPPPDTIVEEYIPMLPLADNGGPTQTQAIGAGSWAFSRGIYNDQGEADPYTDQRGMAREVGDGVDIGAFESDALFIGRFDEPERVGAPIRALQARSHRAARVDT